MDTFLLITTLFLDMLQKQLRKPPFLERTLPFTYGYVIPKSDYSGNMMSRANVKWVAKPY